ncbi:hypothetical protein AB0M11_26460 [Streptomyces sp. NPDC051987]|uniref:hypothetical protein n=1 Tax=Streptomyces sp. NPDC051987 TaxID=3155808 RepID=UPI00342ACE87
MTAVQLALCDPDWADLTPVPRPRRGRGRRLREREKHDLRGQGLTNRQINRIRTIRLASQEYL